MQQAQCSCACAVANTMNIMLDAPDQDDHVRDLLTRRIPQALRTAQNGSFSFAAAYWGEPPPLPNPRGASTMAHSRQ